jgi:hypothetical protein
MMSQSMSRLRWIVPSECSGRRPLSFLLLWGDRPRVPDARAGPLELPLERAEALFRRQRWVALTWSGSVLAVTDLGCLPGEHLEVVADDLRGDGRAGTSRFRTDSQ